MGPARCIVRDAAHARPGDLSELFPRRRPVAIRRYPAGGLMTSEPIRTPAPPVWSPELGDGLRGEVMRGLLSVPKSLPPKLFYDDAGTRLFERISALQEYYLTRAEVEILRARKDQIGRLAGTG